MTENEVKHSIFPRILAVINFIPIILLIYIIFLFLTDLGFIEFFNLITNGSSAAGVLILPFMVLSPFFLLIASIGLWKYKKWAYWLELIIAILAIYVTKGFSGFGGGYI